MKKLINSYDHEAKFYENELAEAKNYYLPKSDLPCNESEYLGRDYKGYCEQYTEYKQGIEQAENLEELAEVLNNFTDVFDNGSKYEVVEF